MKRVILRLMGAALAAGVLVMLLLAALFNGSAPTQAQTKPTGHSSLAAANDVSIPGSPLSVNVEANGSYAVFRNNVQQFFGQDAEGSYLWVNGQVWGPQAVPAGNDVNQYTPISLNLSGNGSAGNPWVATDVLGVGSTGLQLTQSTSYVNGDEFIRNDFTVCNTGGAAASTGLHLFHAADLYTQGNDEGFGYFDAATGAVGGYTEAHDLYQIFVPITAATHYEEDYYGTIWDDIGDSSGVGAGFHNTYRPNDYIDNGAGLEWIFGVPGSCATFSDFLSFSGTPVLPTVPPTGGPTVIPTLTPSPFAHARTHAAPRTAPARRALRQPDARPG